MAGFDLFGAMMNPGTSEIAPGLSDVQMRRQIMGALLMQSMQQQPTQMAGNIAIPQGFGGALSRVLTGAMAMKGMSGLSEDERALAQQAQDSAAREGANLANATSGTPGTGGTIQEEAGPPTAGGDVPYSTHPGTPGRGPTPQEFASAYEKARFAGVDPKVLADALQQHNRYRNLAGINDPQVQAMLPWNQGGGAAQFTPGDANQGSRVTLPASAPGGGASGGGGGMYGVPSTATAFTLSGDPALEKVGALIGKYAEPQNLREGGSLTKLDANGNPVIALTAPKLPEGTRMTNGTMEPIPGYMDTKGAILSKEAAIKAGYSMVSVDNADGSKTQGYLAPGGVFRPFNIGGSAPAGVAPAPGGNLAGAAMATPGIGTTPGVKIPQQVQGAMNGQRAAVLQGELADNQAALQKNPNDVDAQRNIAAINAELGRPGMAAQPIVGGAAVGRSQSTMAAAESRGLGENLAKQQEQVDTDAAAATQSRGRTSQMRDALQYFDPNAGAPARQKVAEWAQTLPGMTADSPLVKRLAGGDIGAMQEFTKLAFGNSVENLRQMVGPGQRISQLEMITNYKNSPNIGIQKAAINAMLDMQDGVAQWKEDKQQEKDRWVGQKGGYTGFEGWWNRNHPLTGADLNGKPYMPTIADVKARMEAAGKGAPTRAPAAAPGAAPSASAPNIDALVSKYAGRGATGSF